MSIFKKQGVWWVDYYVSGQRKRERVGPDKKLAHTVLQKRKVEIAEGKYLDKRKVPHCLFTELADRYLPWAKVHHRGYSQTRSRVEQWRVRLGTTPLASISPAMLDAIINELAEVHAPATINRELGVLRHMLTKAVEWRIALENPGRHIKPLHVPSHRLRYLSQQEMSTLLDVADEHLRPLILTALHTGMRRGELFKLTWNDVDFKHNLIRVLQSKSGKPRDIPMSDTLRATLQALPRRIDSDYVFYGTSGKALVDIKKGFHRTLRDAGIEGFRFHDLRHTFASHLVMAGVDLVSIKEFLGHADMKMTLRYAHLAPHHKHAAIKRLDTYMDTKHKKEVTDHTVTP